MSSILLHPKLGINPHMAYCPRCGGDAPELVMFGANNGKVTCAACGCVNYGSTQRDKCGKCHESLQGSESVQMTEHERVPGGFCNSCADEVKMMEAVIAEGGVYFKCEKCNSNGVVKADTELAKGVRKRMNVPPPAPCGVILETCPNCPKPEVPATV